MWRAERSVTTQRSRLKTCLLIAVHYHAEVLFPQTVLTLCQAKTYTRTVNRPPARLSYEVRTARDATGGRPFLPCESVICQRCV